MAPEVQELLLAGRYRRVSTLGVGGMARVLLAEDERLGREVAIKQMHSSAPEDSARRLQREARIGAAMSHPNLVSVFDIETEDESVLIVMEYVDGETLREAVSHGPLDTDRALAVVRDIAAALDHIHAQGVVHRDVKPGNVLIGEDGSAKLADLGIATAAGATRITVSGTVLGTAAYMAPEQIEGDKAGPAADVYSLAAVAFEALSGRKARDGATPVEIAHRVATEPPPDLREAWPGAPRGLAEALKDAMAQDPAHRPRSAGQLADRLERAVDEGQTGPTLLAPRQRRVSPAFLPVAAAALALAVAGGAAVTTLGGGDDGDEPAQGATKPGAKAERSPPKRERPRSEPEAPAPAQPKQPAPEPRADPASLNEQGFDLMNQGRYDEAIPVLQRAVDAADPGSVTHAYALYNLGRSLRLAGRADEAVPILERRAKIKNQQGVVKKELKQARKARKGR